MSLTANSTEVSVMPGERSNIIYWYGYGSPSYSQYREGTITSNTNDQTFSNGMTNNFIYLQNDLTNVSNIKTIIKSADSASYSRLFASSTTNWPTSAMTQWADALVDIYPIETPTLKTLSVSSLTGNKYIGYEIWYSQNVTHQALWLE